MTEITKANADEATRALKELRETVESKTATFSEHKEKIEKIEKTLDKYDELDQKRTVELIQAKNKQVELEEKLTALEKLASMTTSKSDTKGISKSIKVFETFLRYGMKAGRNGVERKDGLTVQEFQEMQGTKYMRTDIDIQGGTWAPTDITNELINQDMVEISPIRSIARSQMTSLGSVTIRTKTSHSNAASTGEGAAYTESQMGTGQKEIKVNKNTADVQFSIEMLQDSSFNLMQQITDDVREQLAYREGQQFVKGLGIGNNEAYGFLTNPGTGVGQSGIETFLTNTSTLTSDDLLLLDGQLKSQYNPVYVFNRKVKAFIRTMKGTDGQYYWPNIFAAGAPTTIDSIPFVVANDMPDLLDINGDPIPGNIPVALGDFYKGYRIVDHASLYVVRDDFTSAAQGLINIFFTARVGGDIVVPEAIVLLRVNT